MSTEVQAATSLHSHSEQHCCDHDVQDPLPSLNSVSPPLPSSDSSESTIYVPGNDKKHQDFRNYENSARQQTVENFYRLQHINQTYDTVKALEKKYGSMDRKKMGVWEALEYLNTFVDDSDPDTSLSQLQHALQSAEAIRLKYPDPKFDWFHLVGLIHDLGKILCFSFGEPQHFSVGDTFPVGCKFSDKNIFHKYFEQNADNEHPVYSTFYGVYRPNCGLRKVSMSWGHDEYLYRVCVANGCTLPQQALYCIRFHSFYPWHKEGAYTHLTDAHDREMMYWVKEFNQFDLYSKSDTPPDPAKLKDYYCGLIDKYFPNKLLSW